MQIGLDHGAGLRILLAHLGQDPQRRVGRRVVLHVERRRRARLGRRLDDLQGVVHAEALVQRLTHGGQLDRHLGPRGEPLLGQPAQQS